MRSPRQLAVAWRDRHAALLGPKPTSRRTVLLLPPSFFSCRKTLQNNTLSPSRRWPNTLATQLCEALVSPQPATQMPVADRRLIATRRLPTAPAPCKFNHVVPNRTRG